MVCTLRCGFLRSTGWCYLPFCGHFLKDFCVIPPFKNGISLLSVVSILYTTRRRSISCARRDQNLLLQLTEYWKIPLQRSMPNRVKNSQRHIHMNNLNYHRKIIWWNNIYLLSGTIYKIKCLMIKIFNTSPITYWHQRTRIFLLLFPIYYLVFKKNTSLEK